MKAATGIHWWTFSTPVEVEGVLDVLGGSHTPPEFVGGFGHPQHVVHETGAKVYFGSKDEKARVVVHASGEVCEQAAGELVTAADSLGGRVTRLDLAADLEPADLAARRLREMRRAWKRGQVKTRMAKSSHDWYQSEAEDGGITAYFGSRKSALYLRAYNRRGPLRLEWQWRPDKSVGAAIPDMVLRVGVATMWRSLSASAVFPMPWYEELLNGDRVEFVQAETSELGLLKAIEQIRVQLGTSLWALELLGVPFGDLAVRPERPRAQLAAKLDQWSRDADKVGYNGEKLRAELERCRLKLKRV